MSVYTLAGSSIYQIRLWYLVCVSHAKGLQYGGDIQLPYITGQRHRQVLKTGRNKLSIERRTWDACSARPSSKLLGWQDSVALIDAQIRFGGWYLIQCHFSLLLFLIQLLVSFLILLSVASLWRFISRAYEVPKSVSVQTHLWSFGISLISAGIMIRMDPRRRGTTKNLLTAQHIVDNFLGQKK